MIRVYLGGPEHPMEPSDQSQFPKASDGFVLLGEAQSIDEAPGPQPGSTPTAAAPEAPVAGRPSSLDEEPEIPEHLLQLDELFTELEPIEPEQIVLALAGSAASRLAGRAAFLGFLPTDLAADLALERDWQALLPAGLSAAQLALLVGAEPWLPPVHQGRSFCGWLVSQAVVTQPQLDALHTASMELGWPIFQVALEQGVLDERRYVEQLSRFCDLDLAAAPRGVDRALLVGFPLGWVEHFDLCPLGQGAAGLVVGLARPLPPALLGRLEADVGAAVECRLTSPAEIAAWRRRWLRHWWRLHQPDRGGEAQG